MFTGIIEELGTVKSVRPGADSAVVQVEARVVTEGLKTGDSVAVNGVCLTVVSFMKTDFSAEVMAETLRKSGLGELKAGDRVNLERALRLTDRLGGHMVSGHIDGVGVVESVVKEDIARVFKVRAPAEVLRYVIKKGSIAVDGISLTVSDLTDDSFSVSIIPHTAAMTTLGYRKPGDKVNLEPDMIVKYVERLLSGGESKAPGGLSKSFLAEHGFL